MQQRGLVVAVPQDREGVVFHRNIPESVDNRTLHLGKLAGKEKEQIDHVDALVNQNPATGLSSINCVDPWLDKIEEATKGKVKIQRYYGQTLAKGKDMWNATKMGITDMGWCFHGYWPGLTPLSDEQAKYIGVPKEGPYKPDSYRY